MQTDIEQIAQWMADALLISDNTSIPERERKARFEEIRRKIEERTRLLSPETRLEITEKFWILYDRKRNT